MFDPRINGWNSKLVYPSTYEADVEQPLRDRVAALEAAIAALTTADLSDFDPAVRAIVQDEIAP